MKPIVTIAATAAIAGLAGLAAGTLVGPAGVPAPDRARSEPVEARRQAVHRTVHVVRRPHRTAPAAGAADPAGPVALAAEPVRTPRGSAPAVSTRTSGAGEHERSDDEHERGGDGHGEHDHAPDDENEVNDHALDELEGGDD